MFVFINTGNRITALHIFFARLYRSLFSSSLTVGEDQQLHSATAAGAVVATDAHRYCHRVVVATHHPKPN